MLSKLIFYFNAVIVVEKAVSNTQINIFDTNLNLFNYTLNVV